MALCSNVVHKFTCSCDMNLTYCSMSTRHLITRVREHLDFNSIQRSAIKDHILFCDICSDVQHGLKSFRVIKKCQSKFHTKIHEALLIKKDTPKLNHQLYAKRASFLIQVFYIDHMLVFASESVKFCCINVGLNRPDCISTPFKLII